MMKRRRDLGLPAPRQLKDEYFNGLLAVWDAREGWTGDLSRRYDPTLAVPLIEAAKRTKAKPDYYYRAFQLVTGIPYSSIAWEIIFGAAWQNSLGLEMYRRLRAMPQRRKTGRHRGNSSHRLRTLTTKASPGVYTSDPLDDMTAAAIERLRELLIRGVAFDVAGAEVQLGDLSEELRQLLSNQVNKPLVEDWIARGAPI
jgi:hypothetical protein